MLLCYVQTRAFVQSERGKKCAVKYATIDSHMSLLLAFFVNAAMLVVAGAVFHYGKTPM